MAVCLLSCATQKKVSDTTEKRVTVVDSTHTDSSEQGGVVDVTIRVDTTATDTESTSQGVNIDSTHVVEHIEESIECRSDGTIVENRIIDRTTSGVSRSEWNEWQKQSASQMQAAIERFDSLYNRVSSDSNVHRADSTANEIHTDSTPVETTSWWDRLLLYFIKPVLAIAVLIVIGFVVWWFIKRQVL